MHRLHPDVQYVIYCSAFGVIIWLLVFAGCCAQDYLYCQP